MSNSCPSLSSRRTLACLVAGATLGVLVLGASPAAADNWDRDYRYRHHHHHHHHGPPPPAYVVPPPAYRMGPPVVMAPRPYYAPPAPVYVPAPPPPSFQLVVPLGRH